MKSQRLLHVLVIALFSLFFVFSVKLVSAGRSWVGGNNSSWHIERTCRNGADFVSVHDESWQPEWEQNFAKIEVTIRPKYYTHEPPSGLLNSDGNLTQSSIDTKYYPPIGSRQFFEEGTLSDTPYSTDRGFLDEPRDYYLHTSGIVRFYDEMPIGAWIVYSGMLLDQVQDCYIDPLSSIGTTSIDHIETRYSHIPTDTLVYQVDTAPLTGNLQLDSTSLVNGSQFTAVNLSATGLTFSGEGGEQTATLSVQATYRVSLDQDGNQLGNRSWEPAISAAGDYVVFTTDGVVSPLIDTNGVSDVAKWIPSNKGFIVSRSSASTATVGSKASSQGDIAPNGEQVVFMSDSDTLAEGNNCPLNRNIFQRHASTLLVSCEQADGWVSEGTKFGASRPSISDETDEGQKTVYQTDLTVPSVLVDSNGQPDVIGSNTTPTVFSSVLLTSDPFFPINSIATGNGGSFYPQISHDGEHVTFESDATNLVGNDTNEQTDIFVYGTSGRRRLSLNSAGVQANSLSIGPTISRFGEHVSFASAASNLAPNTDEPVFQIYVRDRNINGDAIYDEADDSCTVLVSKSNNGAVGNDASTGSSISANGRFIAFVSRASNLVPSDLPTNNIDGFTDIFVHDRDADGDGSFYSPSTADDRCTPGPFKTFRVSVDSYGNQANDNSFGRPEISANGEFVAFASDATNLVPGDDNEVTDVFVHYLGFTVDLRFSEPPVYHSYLPMINP
ncbi:MAG: hypothetical protein AB8G95_21815 [Anaerolineae bacterium]